MTEGSPLTATMQFLDAHSQLASLLVLTFTAFAILWQATEAGKQAKASVKMAKSSLAQTELMRMQAHATFRPVVTVTHGSYGQNVAMLTLKNLGTGSALGVVGLYRSGAQQRVGSLSSAEETSFRFDNTLNRPPQLVGVPMTESTLLPAASGDVTLRLEYQSVSDANCWTTINFRMVEGVRVEFDEIQHGMDSPSLTTNL